MHYTPHPPVKCGLTCQKLHSPLHGLTCQQLHSPPPGLTCQQLHSPPLMKWSVVWPVYESIPVNINQGFQHLTQEGFDFLKHNKNNNVNELNSSAVPFGWRTHFSFLSLPHNGCVAKCPQMSVDILGTSWDQCRSMVQYSFTSTETRRLVRTDSPGRPPRLSHSSWTMSSWTSQGPSLHPPPPSHNQGPFCISPTARGSGGRRQMVGRLLSDRHCC